jgi:hypothetical protein
MQITFHPGSFYAGAALMGIWLGTAWYIVDKNARDSGTQSVIKAMQSDDSRLVTVTFADGSQILRVPPQGLGVVAPVPAKRTSK